MDAEIKVNKGSWKYKASSWKFSATMPDVILGSIKQSCKFAETKSGKVVGKCSGVEISLTPQKPVKEMASLLVELKNTNKKMLERPEALIGKINLKKLAATEGVKAADLRMLLFNDSGCCLNGRSYGVGTRPVFGKLKWGDVGETHSRLFTVVYNNKNNSGLFIGALPEKRLFRNDFILNGEELEIYCTTMADIKPGETVTLGKILIASGENIINKIEAFTTLFGKPRPYPDLARKAGWNTWDYYLWLVNEEDVIENAKEIKENKDLAKHIKYIVIDDGWQHGYGDWYPNYKFPGCMKQTADKIKKEGFVPGIWTGPYLQSTYGEVARNHPEWLISSKEDGRPVCFTAPFIEVLYLDPTHPGAQKFLKELYERLYADGYRYFKIDFLNNIVSTVEELGGKLYDPTVSPLEAIKIGVKIIRKAVKDSILVGCGGFIPEVGTGLFDSCRASHDISSYWSNNLAISRNIAFKSIFDRNCWENDYDFLIVRGKKTSTNNKINAFKRLDTFVQQTPYEPFKLRRGDTIQTVGEARAWASVLLASGSSVVLSDRIKELNRKGLNLTNKVLELAEGAKGVPLDLLDNPVASVWLARGEKKTILGVFNWTDKTAKTNALKYLKNEGINTEKAKDVWTGKVDNLAKVAIPRRDAKIFIIEN